MIPRLLRYRCAAFILFSITATITCRWRGTFDLRSRNVRNHYGLFSAFSRNRPGCYLVSFVEYAGNLTAIVDDIRTTFPEVGVLHMYPSTKAVAIENVSSRCLDFLQAKPYVLDIEPDFVVKAMKVQENLNKTLEWGIDRIDGKIDRKYHYDFTGKGVRVYVIDSGIRFNHLEFRRDPSEVEEDTPKSRARCGKNFRKKMGEDCLDQWGHGTHVAALIGGKTYGVAKDVELFAVKVFGADGSSRFSDIVASLEYVINKKKNESDVPMVINLSLGTEHVSGSLNRVVNNAVKAGITVVVAAGNGGVDACTYSPASAQLAIAVAASTIDNKPLSYSNWGSCVGIYAPGERIWSAWNGDNNDGSFQTGTSSASPYVAGAAALYLERNKSMTPADIKSSLQNDAFVGVIKNKTANGSLLPVKVRKETPNLLLNVGVFVSDSV